MNKLKYLRCNIYSEQQGKCASCQKPILLHSEKKYKDDMAILHHINHNNKVNDKQNLIFVCPRCHKRYHMRFAKENGMYNGKLKYKNKNGCFINEVAWYENRRKGNNYARVHD